MTPYLSIDIETTGLNPDTCQVIEIGAVLDDWTSPLDELPQFHCFVTHGQIVGEPYALAMNAKILELLVNRDAESRYLKPSDVGFYLWDWLRRKGIDSKNVLAAGKNFASFDLQFLKRLPGFNDDIRFHHRSLDPTMLYWRPDTDKLPPNTEECLRRAGLHLPASKHRALTDAFDVVRLLRAVVKEGVKR